MWIASFPGAVIDGVSFVDCILPRRSLHRGRGSKRLDSIPQRQERACWSLPVCGVVFCAALGMTQDVTNTKTSVKNALLNILLLSGRMTIAHQVASGQYAGSPDFQFAFFNLQSAMLMTPPLSSLLTPPPLTQ